MNSLASRRFEAVIFDMDGLLLDSERPILEAWLRLAPQLRREDYLLTVGRNRPDSLAVLSERLGSEAAALAMYAQVDVELTQRFGPGTAGFPLKPGALALLQALRARGVPLAVASSTRHAKVLERLSLTGLIDFFGPIHGGDQVARGKPHPDLFELAAASLGIHPAKALVFEDSSYGARGALTAGAGVVLVPDLKAPDPEIAPHCLLLDSLDAAQAHIPDWF
ncbi:HAD family phosphatase [Kinneretia asaccharophila]|uniref:HAD superfamily hydrolase (TIGR01509 family) n=1 Tax=Roseateles asaccharophilus TaxID=582607 RepID=A0A4R6MZB5_9BURK|nr:HAD family phosphatase [Roseateles asaccharophilus]MDN3545809.1 HAD family phosphatase [Roseateles asaccharophilus]TDP07676.1 HAD superfamily hydrolase (TIGR01509 family) [Roseateles asaccharophilus]